MTRDERKLLISQSCRSFVVPYGKKRTFHAKGVAIGGNPGATCNVKVEVRYVKLPKPTGRGFVSLGAALNGRPPQWATEPDAKPKTVVRIKRTARKHALTKTAEQLPKKLALSPELKKQREAIRMRA